MTAMQCTFEIKPHFEVCGGDELDGLDFSVNRGSRSRQINSLEICSEGYLDNQSISLKASLRCANRWPLGFSCIWYPTIGFNLLYCPHSQWCPILNLGCCAINIHFRLWLYSFMNYESRGTWTRQHHKVDHGILIQVFGSRLQRWWQQMLTSYSSVLSWQSVNKVGPIKCALMVLCYTGEMGKNLIESVVIFWVKHIIWGKEFSNY